jgi:Zn-dependent protease with chaperone function
MTSAAGGSALFSYLWQVSLHSLVAAAVVFTWASHLGLPSGRSRRLLLALLLALPLVTALVPGRRGDVFRDRMAWFDSARLLELPVLGDVRVVHLALALFAAATAVTLWQELGALRGRRRGDPELPVPEAVRLLVASLPQWESCRVAVDPGGEIGVVTGGLPGRPWLALTRGALDRLSAAELEAVVRHENAHWKDHRWLGSHLLFGFRIIQCYNPLALWVFREYTIELEIACDREAAAAVGPRPLARALLKVYEETDRRDSAARATLRKRVDTLRGRVRLDDAALPATVVAAAALLLLGCLPWIV